jgi:hypothetical protein
MATSLRHFAPFIGAKYNAFWFAPCRPSCSARNIRAAIFDKAAFVAPPPGTQGDFGRNVLRGFGATQVDLALQRQFT